MGAQQSVVQPVQMDTDMRAFREFLVQYNTVTEKCFRRCVVDFTSRNVSDKEDMCTKNCLNKFLKMTQRISTRFQEHQLLSAEAQGATISGGGDAATAAAK